MRKKLLASAWQSYATKVLPATASATQRLETRRAFYSGANSFFSELMGAIDSSPNATSDDVSVIARMQDELEQFLVDVKAGRA